MIYVLIFAEFCFILETKRSTRRVRSKDGGHPKVAVNEAVYQRIEQAAYDRDDR